MIRSAKLMTTIVLCATVVCCTLWAFEDDEGEDHKRIQGDWQVTELIHNGKPASQKIIDAAGYFIAKNRLDPTVNGKKREDSGVVFQLNEKTSPKQIDLTEEDSGEINRGIYELKEDRLKLCYFKNKNTRPVKFESKADGPPTHLIVLKRRDR